MKLGSPSSLRVIRASLLSDLSDIATAEHPAPVYCSSRCFEPSRTINMMQMPLLSYPHFSQFLQLQQQQQLQQQYSRGFLPPGQDQSNIGMMSQRSVTSCSEASTGTPSPSPSPPLSVSESYSMGKSVQNKSAKSFTIDAILGIRDRDMSRELKNFPNNFHPRLGLSPRVDMSGAELNSARMQKGRIDIAREVLGLQLPTDLSASGVMANAVGSGELGRTELHHSMNAYQTVASCPRLADKSPTEVSKKCGGKSKRVRTIFTPEQLERLEAEFERQQYMVGPERLYLAHTLQLTEAQVKVWFQNRRIKWRKQHLEIQQQRLAAIKQQQQQHHRSEADDSDNDSVDSANYPFTVEQTESANPGFYKATDSAEGENVNRTQYPVNSVTAFAETLGESIKNEEECA